MKRACGLPAGWPGAVAAAGTAGILFFAIGCGGAFRCRWKDRDITLDGKADDWKGELQTLEDDKVGVGLMNDGRSLYVALAVVDRQRETETVSRGFTVWIDPAGGEAKTLGVHLRRGLGPDDAHPLILPPMEGVGPDSLAGMLEVQKTRVEIVEAHVGGSRHVPLAGTGVELAAGLEKGSLIYEMRLPLAAGGDSSAAIGAAPGHRIGVGIETDPLPHREHGRGMFPDSTRTRRREAPDSTRTGGEEEPGGEGRPGGGEHGRGGDWEGDSHVGGRGQSPEWFPAEPIKSWFKVMLATGKSGD